ncbi:hypothetical protein DENSPDRAFT_794784 [Dentipellis sp. KUC8613]|nr:hypothetical protein DENSPDRAFT_794784 [Dentipellis sp. KUC8613]
MSNISIRVDKELPPTPSSSEDDLPSIAGPTNPESQPARDPSRPPSAQVNFPLSAAQSPSRSSSHSDMSRGTSQPTIALAQAAVTHAALGLGLPHSISRASASSSTSEVNIIPETSSRQLREPGMRRAKSFQKLNAYHTSDMSPVPDSRGRARVRGNSFGSTAEALRSKGKGKGKADEPSPEVNSPRKSLARRASFWNRKRNESLKQKPPIPAREPEHIPHPGLPVLPPISPFYVDTNLSSSSTSSQQEPPTEHPPGLVRRHSERSAILPSPPASQTTIESLTPNRIPNSLSRKSNGRPVTADPSLERSRAQSMFVGPALNALPPVPSPVQDSHPRPPSPPTVTISSARPSPRPRSHTNPPLLHRLSVNLLGFGSSSTAPSPNASVIGTPTMTSSPTASPRPSLSKTPAEIPKPNMDEELPEEYLGRLLEAINKADVASVLASSGDSFYAKALQAYIDRFEFTRYSIDVALRRLLMDVGLPRETQQIDRVMEAFATRYRQCNPDLFISDDHPYILAFSLIMLHTDAFNKSNKRKMTKADYIKNTGLPGIAPEVLDYFYDNIVFAPFIFIEDPLDSVHGSTLEIAWSIPGLSPQPSLPNNASSVTLLGRSTKIDPYYLITNDLLDPLRVDVEAYVPLNDPFDFQGTEGSWSEEELRRAFALARIIEVGHSANRRMSTSLFTMSVAGFPGSVPNVAAFPDGLLSPTPDGVSALRVVKVGLLKRRDITFEGEKRASRSKWREWSVILTGSQLLFFRDPIWANNLMDQAKRNSGHLFFPPVSLLKPDEVIPLKNAVAVYDTTYIKYRSAFRFVSGSGQHFLIQTDNIHEMNEWISRINYASAFKTLGINIRPLGLSGKDVELMGVAAAASHLRELQTQEGQRPASRVRTWDNRSSEEFVDRMSQSPPSSIGTARRKAKTITGRDDIQLEAPTAPDVNGAQQFKAAFDQVKADLAAGRTVAVDDLAARLDGRPRAYSLESSIRPSFLSDDSSESLKSSSRAQIILGKLNELESQITAGQTQLDSDLRVVRNIAVLTPFQRATRERLEASVQSLGKKIKHSRLDLAKLICHHHVLQNDLAAEEWDWNRTKTIALKAATKTLHSRRDPSIPRMTLSLHLDEPDHLVSSPRDMELSPGNTTHVPDCSAHESFHSALDFDWISSPLMDESSRNYTDSPMLDSPLATPMTEEGRNSSASSFPFNAAETSRPTSSHEASARLSGHEKFVTASEIPTEEAEEWNKTRAAKRVSLVKLPSDLRMSLALGRADPDAPPGSSRLSLRSPLPIPEA